MKQQSGFTAYELIVVFWIVLIVVGFVGWVMNVVEIVHSDFAHMSGMLVVRCVGIFIAPLGAGLGYF